MSSLGRGRVQWRTGPCDALSRHQEGLTIVSELDKLGVNEVPLTDRDLHRDPTFVWFIAIGTAREEELAVDLLHILFEPLLQDSVCLVTLLSLERMGNFSAMDGQDEPVSNGVDHFVKVGLGREDVDRSLR
jgi:hypothetical protein